MQWLHFILFQKTSEELGRNRLGVAQGDKGVLVLVTDAMQGVCPHAWPHSPGGTGRARGKECFINSLSVLKVVKAAETAITSVFHDM